MWLGGDEGGNTGREGKKNRPQAVSCEPTDSARELFDEGCEPVEEEQ